MKFGRFTSLEKKVFCPNKPCAKKKNKKKACPFDFYVETMGERGGERLNNPSRVCILLTSPP